MIQSSKRKQTLSFSIFIILLAQINLNIFASNFRVSMGILLLPILVFLYQKIAVMPPCCWQAPVSICPVC